MNLNIASKPHQDCLRKAIVKQLQRAKTDHDLEEVQLCKDLLGLIDLKLEMQCKQVFANGMNPWAGLNVPNTSRNVKEQRMPARQKPPMAIEKAPNRVKESKALAVLDHIGTVEITNDKPKKRTHKPSKYEAVFEKLQPGQAIKCEPRHAHAVANAMRSWQRRRNLDWTTAITLDYGDGFARVFRVK